MLILTRKPGEALIIKDDITITILSINGNQIRLGVEAPKEVEIYRDELWDKMLKNPTKRPEEDKDHE